MDIKTGDELHVFIRGYRHGDSYQGTVVKVGRKYGTVEYGNPHYGVGIGSGAPEKLTLEFDLETGKERNSRQVGAGGSYVCTLEDYAIKQRKAAASATLLRAGISFYGNAGYNLAVEQLEALAAVAADFPEYDRNR